MNKGTAIHLHASRLTVCNTSFLENTGNDGGAMSVTEKSRVRLFFFNFPEVDAITVQFPLIGLVTQLKSGIKSNRRLG